MGLSITLAIALFSSVLILARFNPTNAQNSPQDYVAFHNSARAAVGLGSMAGDSTVASYAEDYANQRSGDCNLVHSGGPYGENIFKGSGKEWTAGDAMTAWVNESQYYDYDYDYNSNTCQDGQICGHYTQVVWRDSVAVGCARVQCDNSEWFITCNYSPPGTILGNGLIRFRDT